MYAFFLLSTLKKLHGDPLQIVDILIDVGLMISLHWTLPRGSWRTTVETPLFSK